MKKIGTKIISYFLLLNFLVIHLPIHELFHEHKTAIIECNDHGSKEHHYGHLEYHKKCSHDAHFFKKPEKHICFFAHFNSPYIISDLCVVFFKSISFDDFLLKNVIKHYFKPFQSYLLRGPPFSFL